MKKCACITIFNQDSYTRKCFEDLLAKKLNCSYEIIIENDSVVTKDVLYNSL
jgi:hypothetical protein